MPQPEKWAIEAATLNIDYCMKKIEDLEAKLDSLLELVNTQAVQIYELELELKEVV